MTERTVVLLSGGMDSATAAAQAREDGHDLSLLHTSYGQSTETRELACAERLAEEFDAAESSTSRPTTSSGSAGRR